MNAWVRNRESQCPPMKAGSSFYQNTFSNVGYHGSGIGAMYTLTLSRRSYDMSLEAEHYLEASRLEEGFAGLH